MALKLVKPALQLPDGSTEFYDNPAEQVRAFAQNRVVPTVSDTVNLDQLLGEPVQGMDFGANQPEVGPQPDPVPVSHPGPDATATIKPEASGGSEPKIAKPSFREQTTDQYGNTKQGFRGLTKLGTLMAVLAAGARGAADAAAGGALDAVPGRSSFGAGLAASGPQGMPFLRRNQAIQQQQQDMALQQQHQEMQPIQTPWGAIPISRALQISRLEKEAAERRKAGIITPRNGGAIDVNTGKYLPGTEPSRADKVLHAYTGADGKQHIILQKPDNSTYDTTYGEVNPKDPNTIDAAALDAMRRANGGNPPTLEQLGSYQKSKAQNTHITMGGGEVKPDDMTAIVDGLVDGTLDVKGVFARLAAPQRIRAIAEAKRIDPSFDMTTFPSRQKVAQDFASGKSADQIQSFNTFLGHAKDLSDAVNDVRNKGQQWINRPYNWLRKQTGDPAITAYLAKIEPVQKEFESFLLNNRALYTEDRKSAEEIVNPNNSPAQMQAAIKSFVHTAAIRLNQVNNRYKNTMKRDYPGLIDPVSQAILDEFGSGGVVKSKESKAAPNPHSDLGFVPIK